MAETQQAEAAERARSEMSEEKREVLQEHINSFVARSKELGCSGYVLLVKDGNYASDYFFPEQPFLDVIADGRGVLVSLTADSKRGRTPEQFANLIADYGCLASVLNNHAETVNEGAQVLLAAIRRAASERKEKAHDASAEGSP